MIENMDAGTMFLSYLLQKHVISNIDSHCLCNESDKYKRNAMLMDIIIRGSEQGFSYFRDRLSSDKHQAYLVDYLVKGITILFWFIFNTECL